MEGARQQKILPLPFTKSKLVENTRLLDFSLQGATEIMIVMVVFFFKDRQLITSINENASSIIVET